MRLTLQRYAINRLYKPGKELAGEFSLFLADALSRFPSKALLAEETERFNVTVIALVPASERRLEELRAATANDPALSTVRSYAETAWPENKEDVPASARPYWAYREEMHAQDGLVFRSNKRLMGQQTRTLLPVPSCHLKPSPLPSREVHTRLQDIRHKHRVYYNRGARDLRTLSPGQRASVYDTHTSTWSPVVVLGSARAPRSVLVKTEDGREMRRTREHLREVPELPCPDTTPTPSSGLPDSGPVPEPPLPRRSSRERREPRRYPLPERS
ncbi:uncharacterized protein LOC144172277 [Haemaphysalis longicornis]